MKLEEKLPIEEVHLTMVNKMRSFFSSCGKSKAVLGLSGGIDSALVAALATEALGADNVQCILLPSEFSSLHSVSDSIDLCNNLGCPYSVVPINKIYSLMMYEMHNFFEKSKWGVAQENLQARIRGTILMTYSNRYDALLLNTSNKSELFAGYGTLYGDLCGALMVLADLYKVQIYEMADYINSSTSEKLIPQAIITKAPSAELRPDQKDTDSLPSYDLLDPVLHALHEGGLSPEKIISHGVSKDLVDKVIALRKRSSFKLLQTPPVLTVGQKPIVPEYKCI